jgi:hypothetical protein
MQSCETPRRRRAVGEPDYETLGGAWMSVHLRSAAATTLTLVFVANHMSVGAFFAAGIARVARSRNVRDLSDPDPVV